MIWGMRFPKPALLSSLKERIAPFAQPISVLCMALSVATSGYWFFRLPAPGKAVAALGAVAVFIALRGEIKDFHGSEKILWTLIVFSLLYIEIRAIDKDRAAVAQEQERDRVEQNKRFSEIAGGITEAIEESQKQFQTTMARSDRMVNLERSAITQVGESIKTQTGGDSFCFVSFTPQESQRAFTVTVTNHGKYPLRGVHLTMSDEEKERRLQIESLRNPDDFLRNIHAAETHFQIPFLLAGDVKMLGMYPFSENDRQDFDVAFGGENGLWVERIRLRRVNGKWVEAIRVLGPTTEQAQHPFEQFDPEYPKGTGKFDWFH